MQSNNENDLIRHQAQSKFNNCKMHRIELQLHNLNLDQAITLLALDEFCDQKLVTEHIALSDLNSDFCPGHEYRNQLIDQLCETQIICSVTQANKLDQNAYENEDRYLEWRIQKNQRKQLIKKINEAIESQSWPNSWSTKISEFAFTLAIEECISYLNYLIDQFELTNLEADALSEKLLCMTKEFKMDECFLLIYRSVKLVNAFLDDNPALSFQTFEFFTRALDHFQKSERKKSSNITFGEFMATPRSNSIRDALLRFIEKMRRNELDRTITYLIAP